MYRLFEILPGLLSWGLLAAPLVLMRFEPRVGVGFTMACTTWLMARATGKVVRSLLGHRKMARHMTLPWVRLLDDLQNRHRDEVAYDNAPAWHVRNVRRLQVSSPVVEPSDILHAVIISAYNETRGVLEPTLRAVAETDFDTGKTILILAYEERGGPAIERTVHGLLGDYGDRFAHALAIKHPADIAGEVIGKGANITYAGRRLQEHLERLEIDPLRVIVTTLDSDNRPHRSYFSALSYRSCVVPDPVHASFQPVALYTNNIWDAPAPMRVIGLGSSIWNPVLSLRRLYLRNFSAHSQGMWALLQTDFWSVKTVVEDGHQFWRSYLQFKGKHVVHPIHMPVYQDAVFADTYGKTLRAQFLQTRRWAWGASDIAYVAYLGFKQTGIDKVDLTRKLLYMLETQVSWAVGGLVVPASALGAAVFTSGEGVVAQPPPIFNWQKVVGLSIIALAIVLSFRLLPPRPTRYSSWRTLLMLVQWFLLPVNGVVFHALPALCSQTRLMFGRYLDTFDVTDKAVATEGRSRVSRRSLSAVLRRRTSPAVTGRAS